MKIKGKICTLTSLILSAVMAFGATVYAAGDLSALQDKNNQLTQEQEKLEQQLEDARKNITDQESLKKALEANIKSVEEKIDNLNITILSYNEKIDLLTEEITQKEAEIEYDYQMLRNRLKILYMAGDASTLELLLGAKDFSDFIDKMTLVKTLSRSDQRLVDDLKIAIEEINQQKNKLSLDKQAVIESKNELELERGNLSALTAECDQLIAKLADSVTDLEEKQHANQEAQKVLSDEIAAWHAKYIKENQISLSGITSDSTLYTWPAPGCTVVTAYWGDSRNHKGTDITCNGSSYGMPIVAAADGTVVIANKTDSWGSGWGYYIMIDHGGGFATQYAHCSYVAVNTGDTVKAGQIIGYIGNTGNSYGAHLHFECWYNGQRYDPAIRLGL